MPLARKLSGRYPCESRERSRKEDHHQFLGSARRSSCSCHRSAFQYLPIQDAATLPDMGRGARPERKEVEREQGEAAGEREETGKGGKHPGDHESDGEANQAPCERETLPHPRPGALLREPGGATRSK